MMWMARWKWEGIPTMVVSRKMYAVMCCGETYEVRADNDDHECIKQNTTTNESYFP